MMPAPRKPAAILEMSGALGKNPSRRRVEPSVALPFGKPPAHLSRELKAAWREISRAAPCGVLTGADRVAVELAARLLVRIRTADTFTAADANGLRSLLSSLGMTPADRSRVTAAHAGPPTNPFSKHGGRKP